MRAALADSPAVRRSSAASAVVDSPLREEARAAARPVRAARLRAKAAAERWGCPSLQAAARWAAAASAQVWAASRPAAGAWAVPKRRDAVRGYTAATPADAAS